MEAARGERQYSSGTIRKRLSLYAVMIQICSCQLLHFMAVINFTTVAIHLQWNCQFQNLLSEHYLKCLLNYAPCCFSVALIFLIALSKENIKKNKDYKGGGLNTHHDLTQRPSAGFSAQLSCCWCLGFPLFVPSLFLPVCSIGHWGGVQLKLQSWASHIRP